MLNLSKDFRVNQTIRIILRFFSLSKVVCSSCKKGRWYDDGKQDKEVDKTNDASASVIRYDVLIQLRSALYTAVEVMNVMTATRASGHYKCILMICVILTIALSAPTMFLFSTADISPLTDLGADVKTIPKVTL